jgi:predicted dehydrogenase
MRLSGVPSIRSEARSVRRDGEALRVAVFGAGKAACFHLQAMEHIDGVEIVGVCSPSGVSAARIARDHRGAIHTTDPQVLVGTGPDAALVAVPAAASPPLVRMLLEAGIPVLAEKPVAMSADEAGSLAELAAARATLAAVAVNRRSYSLVLQAIAAVRERGPVRGVLVEAHEPLEMLMRSGSVDARTAKAWPLLNSVHFVDLLRLVGGEVETISVRHGAEGGLNRATSASMSFASGAVGTFIAQWNCASPPSMKVYGDEVTAEVELGQPESAFLRFAGKRRIKLVADAADTMAKPGVLDQDTAFLRAVSDGRTSVPHPASDLADHARTLRLTEAIFG